MGPLGTLMNAPPLALAGFLPTWDAERRRAELAPVVAGALEPLGHLGHPAHAADLGELHRTLDAPRVRALAQELAARSLEAECRPRVGRGPHLFPLRSD
jgi:hypothetical protein